jgi:probable rRNA maturation factor
VDRRRLRELLLAVLAAERAPAGEIALLFIGERVMWRINREFRNRAESTDVLSFSYVDEPHAGGQLGEIFVSHVVAARQAREAGCPLPEEIARVAVHGLLHVLGWTHDTTADRRRMTTRQEKYVKQVPIGAAPS